MSASPYRDPRHLYAPSRTGDEVRPETSVVILSRKSASLMSVISSLQSKNTRDIYRVHLLQLGSWLDRHGLPTSAPVSDPIVIEWLRWMSETAKYKPATVRARLASLTWLHRMVGAVPPRASKDVNEAYYRYANEERGANASTLLHHVLSADDVRRIVRVSRESLNEDLQIIQQLRVQQDIALILLAFSSGLGAQQLGLLRMADIDVSDPNYGLFTTTHPARNVERALVAVAGREGSPQDCAIEAVRLWMEIHPRPSEARLFVRVRDGKHTAESNRPLHYSTFLNRLRYRALEAGVVPDGSVLSWGSLTARARSTWRLPDVASERFARLVRHHIGSMDLTHFIMSQEAWK